MKRIPISAARRIAEDYGYDQVVIYARKVTTMVDGAQSESGEHMTTYGVNAMHCAVAGAMGKTLRNFMGWKTNDDT